jgi:hypothetical protein
LIQSHPGVGAGGGEMNQALYAHMNNKRKMKKKKKSKVILDKKVHKTPSQPIAGCGGMGLSTQLWQEV